MSRTRFILLAFLMFVGMAQTPVLTSQANAEEPTRQSGLLMVHRGPGGTAVLIDKGGFILTSLSVVGRDKRVMVSLADGPDQYSARVVETDPGLGIALLQADSLPEHAVPYRLASPAPQAGDRVVVVNAVATPLGGFAQLNAEIDSASSISYDLSLSLNAMSQGAAVLNSDGELLAIVGGGMVIPIEKAADVLRELLQFGRVRKTNERANDN